MESPIIYHNPNPFNDAPDYIKDQLEFNRDMNSSIMSSEESDTLSLYDPTDAAFAEFDAESKEVVEEVAYPYTHEAMYRTMHLPLIRLYFGADYQKRIVRHHLESYNYFINSQLEQTIRMFSPLTAKSPDDSSIIVQVHFDNLRLNAPQVYETNGAVRPMLPQVARMRNFAYSSAMTIDLKVQYTQPDLLNEDGTPRVTNKLIPEVHIGKLPVMVKSDLCILNTHPNLSPEQAGECAYDPGGYFIINGSEKVIIAQDHREDNRICCHKSTVNKYQWVIEIRSIPEYRCISPKQTDMMITTRKGGLGQSIYVECPRLKRRPIPLFVLFRALGVVSDKDICEHVLFHAPHPIYRARIIECLRTSLSDADEILTVNDALDYIVGCITYHSSYGGTAAAAEAATIAAEEAAAAEEPSAEKPSVQKETDATEIQAVEELAKMEEEKKAEAEKRAERKRDYIRTIIESDILPHCSGFMSKAHFLGYMASTICQVHLGIREPDDQDATNRRRVDTTGVSLNNLFRNYFNKMTKDMERAISKEIKNGIWRSTENVEKIITLTNIYHIVKPNTIENGLKRALSTGDFSIKHNNSNKVGVAQVLNRLTCPSGLSHLRRGSAPPDKSGKLIPPRKLHGGFWGFWCPSESPEGHSVGIVRNLSIMAHITIASDSRGVYEHIIEYIAPIGSFDICNPPGNVKVFLNGAWIGVVAEDDPNAMPAYALYRQWKQMKYDGRFNAYISIVFDMTDLQIRICTDAGRMSRPLLRVENGRLLLTSQHIHDCISGYITWDDLLVKGAPNGGGIIEYVDAEEQAYSLVAVSWRDLSKKMHHYTHCEIHASTIFGVIAACIPFSNFNQAPRVTYQAAQQKQAVGRYATNFEDRMDKTSHVLTTPMRPLVDTIYMNMLHLNKLPSGCTVRVAIMSYTGYNQEDSMLFNEGAIDRGLLHLTSYHTKKDEDKQNINGDEEIRCRPDISRTRGRKCGNYDKVNEEGLIPENTLVEDGDIIIAKVVPIKGNRQSLTEVHKFEDRSKIYHTNEPTYIDRNVAGRNGGGYNFVKVRLRAPRKPIIGDKFSSRHGQKGTIGNILPEKDMPYDEDGNRPDIIINPHAFPSRMTEGHLNETVLGRILLNLGLLGDGTAFGDVTMGELAKLMIQLGYESHGERVMYSGFTGEQLKSNIFMGPVFYQRLKHMVIDKQHARASGITVKLTRQPSEGRARNGGLRLGEMEKDAVVAHGAARFARERLYDVSDKYEVHVCKPCGMIAAYNDAANIHVCRTCDNRTEFRRVQIPYSCKLLFQELMGMGIAPRLAVE